MRVNNASLLAVVSVTEGGNPQVASGTLALPLASVCGMKLGPFPLLYLARK